MKRDLAKQRAWQERSRERQRAARYRRRAGVAGAPNLLTGQSSPGLVGSGQSGGGRGSARGIQQGVVGSAGESPGGPAPSRRTSPQRKKKAKQDAVYLQSRQIVLARSGGACWFTRHPQPDWPKCWGGVETHHKLSRARGGTHEPENLEPLCRACHDRVHHNRDGRRLAESVGLLLRRTA